MKTKQKQYKSDIFAAIHQTVSGLNDAGLVDQQTMRRFDESCLTPVKKLAPEEIRAIREDSMTSQSVFARYLGVTPGLISQWERGEKSPSGPALKLLSLVKNKGLETIA